MIEEQFQHDHDRSLVTVKITLRSKSIWHMEGFTSTSNFGYQCMDVIPLCFQNTY